ncbi:MAG: S1 RNA-binding domain-containing protein [bacterium]
MENNIMEQEFNMPKNNQIVEGTVVSVKQDLVIIDLNTFTEGELSLSNYSYDNLNTFIGLVNIGDKITCVITEMHWKKDDNSITVSRLPLIKEENKKLLDKIFDEKQTLSVKIEKKVNRGYVARHLGVEIFIPEGQIDLKLDETKDYVGETVNVSLIDKKEKNFVGSVRVLLQENLNANKEKEYNDIKVGEEITGTVYKIEKFGALIKFEYNIGLLRISQISHERIDSVEKVLKLNDKVTVKVIKKEEGKIDLSRKALLETPHKIYSKNNKVSDVVIGTVIQKLPIGIIVELEKNITALIHKNEFSWNPNDNSMAFVKIGDSLEAAIITMDVEKERIGLSKKVLIDNPWSRVTAQVGDLTDVKISEIISGKGVTVNAYGVDGFIAQRDLVFAENQHKIEDAYQVGDELKAIVVEVNPRYWKLNLSAKKHADAVERIQFEEFMSENEEEETTISLGDVFKDLLK